MRLRIIAIYVSRCSKWNARGRSPGVARRALPDGRGHQASATQCRARSTRSSLATRVTARLCGEPRDVSSRRLLSSGRSAHIEQAPQAFFFAGEDARRSAQNTLIAEVTEWLSIGAGLYNLTLPRRRKVR